MDDQWSTTGGAAENCALADCEHDMGLSTKDVADITEAWGALMTRTQARVLALGGFDWRMFEPGAGTCAGAPWAGGGAGGKCVSYMRTQCVPGGGSLQSSAMMYGLVSE